MTQLILSGVTLKDLLSQIEQLLDAKIGIQHQQTENKKSGYLSRKEVANLLKVTLPTLHDYSKHGLIKSYKIGARVLYKECEVLEAIERVSLVKHKKTGGLSYGY